MGVYFMPRFSRTPSMPPAFAYLTVKHHRATFLTWDHPSKAFNSDGLRMDSRPKSLFCKCSTTSSTSFAPIRPRSLVDAGTVQSLPLHSQGGRRTVEILSAPGRKYGSESHYLRRLRSDARAHSTSVSPSQSCTREGAGIAPSTRR